MNYYEHHIGDYAEATLHLNFVEDAAYTRLIRKYYSTEKPLPADVKTVQRIVGARTKEEKNSVVNVLKEFFSLEADGWHNKRCDIEIEKFLSGEPEREIKRANEDNRLKRHRDERTKLFKALTDAGLHASWNISIKDLREMVEGLHTPQPETFQAFQVPEPETLPETAPATAPATPATATQTPDTRHQTPVVNQSQKHTHQPSTKAEPEPLKKPPSARAPKPGPVGPPTADPPQTEPDPPPEAQAVPEPEPEPATEPDPVPEPVAQHPTPTALGLACRAMRSSGLPDANPAHPKLAALVAAGITEAELADAAREAAIRQKGFAYALGIAEGRRRDAATVTALPANPQAQPPNPDIPWPSVNPEGWSRKHVL